MNKTANDSPLKLNYRRTFLIGFAFFGILLLWQVYDSWCPTFLTDIFARRMYGISSAELKAGDPAKILNVQWLVGIIMACDNLAALILLPIFGNLSDKTKTPIGKRMPYILTGTAVAALAFPFIPLFFHYNNIAGMVAMMAIVLIFMMMYRNPAVALMPDITPKPLRAKANGIINIMGYLGGAFATVLGIFLKLSDYINAADEARKVWIIELPFIIASVLMVISALVLFFTIKENKIAEEMKDEMAEGERLAAVETPIDDDKPMSKANKRMLLAILGAEFLWFMSDNAIGTYIGNYVIYYLNSASSATMVLTIAGGLASVIGFAIAGGIAEKIGRKWTISCGLLITFAMAYLTATTSLIYLVDSLYLVLTIAELALVFVLSSRVQTMSVGAARATFFGYALLNGMVLSYYFLVFSASTLIMALLATSLYFGLMAVYGTTTHKDLTGWGPRLMMALVAMIITGFVGMLFGFGFGGSVLYCGIGLVVFMLLTAYDTQKLQQMYSYYSADAEMAEKASIYGALTLYLDFINIFLYVVRLMGNNRRRS